MNTVKSTALNVMVPVLLAACGGQKANVSNTGPMPDLIGVLNATEDEKDCAAALGYAEKDIEGAFYFVPTCEEGEKYGLAAIERGRTRESCRKAFEAAFEADRPLHFLVRRARQSFEETVAKFPQDVKLCKKSRHRW